MEPERWQRVKELFEIALRNEPHERRQFLKRVCGSDLELCEEVASLLVAHEEAGSFIAAPAIEDFAELLFDDDAEQHFGRLISHYRPRALLGKGGMGEVYLATDTRLGREVALKLLPAEFIGDADRVKRFEREARIASALNHPNILTIYEIGRDGETFFIATELVKGETLRQRLDAGALDLTGAINTAIQVGAALDAAHGAGIVHRDIKPENIMLRPDGYVKVLDFGLARPIDAALSPCDHSSRLTRDSYESVQGTLLGTFLYMSPEQARGQEVDHRSDIWSLGVVLYEMVAGRVPFDGDTPSDTIAAILKHEMPPLAGLCQPELQSIIARALAKERTQRYQSAKELLDDLEELKRKLERRSENETSAGIQRADVITSIRTPVTTQAIGAKRRRKWPAAIAVLLSILAVSSAFIESKRQPPSAPSGRVMSYSLMVQKMEHGEPVDQPFEASASESFESGWKFGLKMASPQSGHLYLLNEGTAPGGNYTILYPIDSVHEGFARLAANEPVWTGWSFFDDRPGVEKVWIVWTTHAVDVLEAVRDKVNPIDKGVIKNPAQRDSIRAWLAEQTANQPAPEMSATVRETIVRGQGEVLVSLIRLKHREARASR